MITRIFVNLASKLKKINAVGVQQFSKRFITSENVVKHEGQFLFGSREVKIIHRSYNLRIFFVLILIMDVLKFYFAFRMKKLLIHKKVVDRTWNYFRDLNRVYHPRILIEEIFK